jgi:hypothetical protein
MKLLFLFLSIILCTACSEKEVFSTTCNTSNPLEELTWLLEIKETIDKTACASSSTIAQYLYNSNSVFEVNPCGDVADGQTVIYDCKGNVICVFGGFSGENTCPNFYEKATNKIILYEN